MGLVFFIFLSYIFLSGAYKLIKVGAVTEA
jgi:hypothetical protein